MRISVTGLLICLIVLLAGPPAAVAVDSRLEAFFGGYAGTAVSRNRDSEYFGVTVRDLDFTIEAHGEGGFSITWTTVTRERGTPRNPDERTRTATMTFERIAPGRNVFKATGSQDPLAGEYYAWARIVDQTLAVHIMTIDESGAYQVATYERTLTAGGMDISFTRVRDGDEVRQVTGRVLRER